MRRRLMFTGAAVAAMAGLVACGGGPGEEGPTSAVPGATAASGTPAATDAPAGPKTCNTDGAAELVWDGMVAADDDWAAWYGTTWRHSYAYTITSKTTDLFCRYSFDVDVKDTVTGDYNHGSKINVALGPGQSFSGQVFYLEEDFKFSGDAKDATPGNPLEPSVVRSGKARVFDGYYDAAVTIGEVKGEGKDAILPVTINQRGVADGMIPRLWSATQDVLFVNGLDADGNVAVSVNQWIFPVEDGTTETIELPLGGGPSSDEVMTDHPTDALERVVAWELAAYQPVLFEDEASLND